MKEYFIFLSVIFCGKFCAGYLISPCRTNNTFNVDGAQRITLTCTGITADTMTWDLPNAKTGTRLIADCTWSTMSCSEYKRDWFEVNRTQMDTSTLIVKRNNGASILVRCAGQEIQHATTCTVRFPSSQQVRLEIIGIPENNVLTEGETRTLSCKVTGNVTPVGGVTFFCGDKRGDSVDTQSMQGGVTVTTSNLTFAPVTASDDGIECQCNVSSSPLSAHGAPFTLSVKSKHEEQKLPVVAIAAGAGALLLIVAIVVTVIVVVVVKRKKHSHEHDGTKARKREDVDEYQNGQYANTASNRFEEDAEDETSFNYASVSPAGAKPTNQQSQYNNAGAKPTNQQSQYNNLGGNLYSNPEEADEENPTHAASPAVQIQDEYAVINKPGAQGNQEHQADVYAVVEKTNKQQGAAEPQAATDEYAVVQKTKSPTSAEPQADVYAVVQKSK